MIKRNNSHNFENLKQKKNQTKMNEFTNIASSLSYTNRLNNESDYNQWKEKTIDFPKSMKFFSHWVSNSSERIGNRSLNKQKDKWYAWI